jgi:hypothetical protein
MKFYMTPNYLWIIISIILLFGTDKVRGQVLHFEDSVLTDVVSFLQKENQLEKRNTLSEYQKRVYFFEVVRERLLQDRSGVYVFGASSSETEKYIMIVTRGKWKLYDMRDVLVVFNDLCKFLSECAVSNDDALKYAAAIVDIFKYNEKY